MSRNKIELQRFMDSAGISKKEMADKMFPMHKHSGLALNRVLNGESALDENQILRLANMLGVTVDDLFTEKTWNARFHEGVHVFSKGKYEARLDAETMTTEVYLEGSLETTVVMSSKNVTLIEYINFLNKLVC